MVYDPRWIPRDIVSFEVWRVFSSPGLYISQYDDVPINDLTRATGEYCTCARYIRNFPDTPLRSYAA